jgi:hypothetical protein
MAIESDLNIFISWSGDLAKRITNVLIGWLPTMFDHVRTFFSGVDIDAGSRGLNVIQDQLDVSSFGIIVVTTENLNKPWLLFESGALSKRLNGDLTKVVPVLVGFDDVSQIAASPLFQFQSVLLDEDGARSLCLSIARTIAQRRAGVDEHRLEEAPILRRFERCWRDLKDDVEAAIEASGEQPAPPNVDQPALLRAMYQSLQSLQQQVADLRNSGPVVVSPTPARIQSLAHSLNAPSPWADGQRMQATQDAIEQIAASYKPVRYVTPMERNGERVVGVMFADGEGLPPEDVNTFMLQVSPFAVTVAIVTDQ